MKFGVSAAHVIRVESERISQFTTLILLKPLADKRREYYDVGLDAPLKTAISFAMPPENNQTEALRLQICASGPREVPQKRRGVITILRHRALTGFGPAPPGHARSPK
jgi:hypothetical protein